MSPTLRPPGLRGAAHGLVREQLGVAGELLLGERPIRERGELHPRPSRQVQLRAVVGELADPQDVTLPLGHADGAARVEQVEGVRALQAVVVRRKRSEEHTSELQSRSDLVCRLLLEKKKTIT